MSAEYSIRPYHPGDEEEIVGLLRKVFNGWPRFDLDCSPIEHWEWKYRDNPMEIVVLPVALKNDKVIGCVHCILQRVKIGNKVFLSSNEADVAVHPDYRRMGIYNRMKMLQGELLLDAGIKFLFGIESNPVLIKKNLEGGPDVMFPQAPMILIRVQDIDLHLRMMDINIARNKIYGLKIIKFYNKIMNNLKVKNKLDNKIHISDATQFDERIDEFWNEIKKQYNFIVERTRAYLNWRYRDPRGGSYLVKQALEDGRTLGYIVIRINRYVKGYSRGYIVDMLTLPDRLDAADALVKKALRYFDSNDVNIVQCQIIRNHYFNSVLKRQGFIDSKLRILANHRRCPEIDEEIKRFHMSPASKIHLAYGDVDWI